MKLLIEQYRKCFVALDRSIDQLYTKLEHFKCSPQFKEYEEGIKLHFDQVMSDTLVMKEPTFWKDKIAFQERNAYTVDGTIENVNLTTDLKGQWELKLIEGLTLLILLFLPLHRIHKNAGIRK